MSRSYVYKIEDWRGRKVGNRIVLCEIPFEGTGKPMRRWLTRCDCGYEGIVQVSPFVKGKHGQCISCANSARGRSKSQQWRGFGSIPGTAFGVMRALALRRGIPLSVSEFIGMCRSVVEYANV